MTQSTRSPIVALFTDYGNNGPYVGQLKLVLSDMAPHARLIDLMHDAPSFNSHAGAHLLAALRTRLPIGGIALCVVDPGVGGPRASVVVEADGRYFVGPDNGLFSVVAQRSRTYRVWQIDWVPEQLSATFHGRDLFAPIAARLALGESMDDVLKPTMLVVNFTADDLARIIYVDHYGNAWTGLRGEGMEASDVVTVGQHVLKHAPTFGEAARGQPFWYINSVGLVEIAANRASAAETLSLNVGEIVTLSRSPDNRLH